MRPKKLFVMVAKSLWVSVHYLLLYWVFFPFWIGFFLNWQVITPNGHFQAITSFPAARTGAWDCSCREEVFTLSEYHVVLELQSAASCLRNGSNFSNVNQCLPATLVIYGSRNAKEQRGRESAAEYDFLPNGLICDNFWYAEAISSWLHVQTSYIFCKAGSIQSDQRTFTGLTVAHHVRLEHNSVSTCCLPCASHSCRMLLTQVHCCASGPWQGL